MKINNLTCSYLFFALLSFNALALLSSEFSPTFSRIFALLSQIGKSYDIFCIFLLSVTTIAALINSFRIFSLEKTANAKSAFVSLVASLCATFLMILLLYYLYEKIIIARDFAMETSLDSRNYLEIESTWGYYESTQFFISMFCWVFLILLPLCYDLFRLNLNLEKSLARTLLILKPSLTTAAIAIVASAFHPCFSDLASRYASLLFACSGGGLLAYLIISGRGKFGFYDYANALLLALALLLFLLCSNTLIRADFYSAQLSFYILALLSWCGDWVENGEVTKHLT